MGASNRPVVDENTLVVAYDYRRGETRGPLRRQQTPDQRNTLGLGDCVNCFQCVAVCPTGIDIRNGTQMECVHCTACIDACDAVMDKIGRPRGLIRYASLNSIEQRKPFRFTPRLAGYTAVLLVLASVPCISPRNPFARGKCSPARPGALFQQTAEGKLQNLYLLKVVNKTTHDITVTLKLENVGGLIQVMGRGNLTVPKADLAQTSVLVQLGPKQLIAGKAKLLVGIYSNGKRIETVETTFVGPRNP
jgi:cytochrome c oxidase accessory protein FixG